jgi:hypothetical protein
VRALARGAAALTVAAFNIDDVNTFVGAFLGPRKVAALGRLTTWATSEHHGTRADTELDVQYIADINSQLY